jgi:hypothetical protein
MSRLLSPDDRCVQVDVPFGRGTRYSGQAIEVSDPVHARALKAAGYTAGSVAGTPVRRGGYHCEPCGFASFFRLCSRCGGVCERPDLIA